MKPLLLTKDRLLQSLHQQDVSLSPRIMSPHMNTKKRRKNRYPSFDEYVKTLLPK